MIKFIGVIFHVWWSSFAGVRGYASSLCYSSLSLPRSFCSTVRSCLFLLFWFMSDWLSLEVQFVWCICCVFLMQNQRDLLKTYQVLYDLIAFFMLRGFKLLLLSIIENLNLFLTSDAIQFHDKFPSKWNSKR